MTTAAVPAALSGPTPALARSSVVVPLALVEARRLLAHPVVLVGLGLSCFLFTVGASDPNQSFFMLTAGAAMPVAGATLVATHLAASRPSRSAASEVLAPLPARPAQRTLALLASVAAPAGATLVVVAVAGAFLGAWGDGVPVAFVSGERDVRPGPLELVQPPVVVAFGGALGVLVGTLVRSAVVAPLLVVVLYFQSVFTLWWMQGVATWLAVMLEPFDNAGWVDDPGTGGHSLVHGIRSAEVFWHSAVVLALAVALGAVAVWRSSSASSVRDGRSR